MVFAWGAGVVSGGGDGGVGGDWEEGVSGDYQPPMFRLEQPREVTFHSSP
jgi:hypothetical protein